MGQMSSWFRNEMLKMTFNRDIYTPVWDRFELCALLEDPVLELDDDYLVEPVGMGYGRLIVPFTSAYWTLTEMGEVSNAQTHTWAAATGTWGPIIGYAFIASASSGGFDSQLAMATDIPGQPRIVAGNQLQLPAGQFMAGLYDSP